MADLSIVYRTLLTVAAGDEDIVDAGGGLFYKEFDISEAGIKTGSTLVKPQFAESRYPSVPEPSLGLEHRGAFVRLQSADVLRLYWRGALVEDEEAGNETISCDVQLLDFDQIGDMHLETHHRLQRILGELGINMIQDRVKRDDAGNVAQYRIRTFTTKALAQAATDVEDGDPLEEGEMSRRTVYVDIDIRRNDRTGLLSLLDRLMDTPGLTVEE